MPFIKSVKTVISWHYFLLIPYSYIQSKTLSEKETIVSCYQLLNSANTEIALLSLLKETLFRKEKVRILAAIKDTKYCHHCAVPLFTMVLEIISFLLFLFYTLRLFLNPNPLVNCSYSMIMSYIVLDTIDHENSLYTLLFEIVAFTGNPYHHHFQCACFQNIRDLTE